jgi:hypothetical protein
MCSFWPVPNMGIPEHLRVTADLGGHAVNPRMHYAVEIQGPRLGNPLHTRIYIYACKGKHDKAIPVTGHGRP